MGKWADLVAAQSARETEKAMKASLELQRQESARRAREEAAARRAREEAARAEAAGRVEGEASRDLRLEALEARIAGLEARVQLLTDQLRDAREQ